MIDAIRNLEKKILMGEEISKEEAKKIITIDVNNKKILNELFNSSKNIKEKNFNNYIELCSIINAKSGKCSEDCKFCAQSSHYSTNVEEYNLLNYDKILKKAKSLESKGVKRFSLVTSGRGIDNNEFEKLLNIYSKLLKDTNLKLCASHGILTLEQVKRLKEVGVSRYHHNLETSEKFYPNIVTTHDYRERIETIKNCKEIGMEICSGGIIGLGETLDDILDMAFELKKLEVESVPINVLMPVENTPLQNSKELDPYEILKIMAVLRFILPKSYIRYAGGRIKLKGLDKKGYDLGVNGVLVGDFLTTIGSKVDEDIKLILESGFGV